MPISTAIDNASAAQNNPSAISAWVADAYLAASSQYVYRGVALSEHFPVPILGASIRHASGWFIDSWGAQVDTAAERYVDERSRVWLLDINAGYGAQLSPAWQWAFSRAWVAGLNSRLDESQNYQEWRANLFYRDDLALQLAYTENYRQTGASAWNAEIKQQHYLTPLFSGEWGAGHSHHAGFPDRDYYYGWLGVETAGLDAQWQLRWTHSDDNARYVLGTGRAGNHIELSATWHFALRR